MKIPKQVRRSMADCSAVLSYDQIGKLLGISAVRVRQIEQRGLAKLRRGFRRIGINGR